MSRGRKLTAEEKVKIVRKYQSEELSQREAARAAGIAQSSFQTWIRLYEKEGAAAFLPRQQYRVYSAEMKEAAVRAYQAGEGSQQEICKRYGIRSKHQLQNWIKVYNAHGDFNSRKGSGGGSYMKQGRNTTQEERVRIAKECIASGKNYGKLALKYQVSYQQARTWTLRYNFVKIS